MKFFQMDCYLGPLWQWKDVLDRLLQLVSEPINQTLKNSKTTCLPGLTKHCCHLLARVVAELVHQCSTTEVRKLYNCVSFSLKWFRRKIYKVRVGEYYT